MNRKNLPIFIALAIPILMIAIISALIYLPGIGKKPQYNFVYYYRDYTYNSMSYDVVNGKIVARTYAIPPVPGKSNTEKNVVEVYPELYLYNVTTNQVTEMNFQEAQNLKLNAVNTSPDGYTVSQGSGGGGLFGSSGDYTHYYIRGYNRSKQLNLKQPANYYNFQFLGWVQQS